MQIREFEIESGVWRESMTFSFPIRQLIVEVRDSEGDRVESGLPSDFMIDAPLASPPVRTVSETRRAMEEVFGYSTSSEDLEAPGGQDVGVLVYGISNPAGAEIHLNATWPEALGPKGKLTIMADG